MSDYQFSEVDVDYCRATEEMAEVVDEYAKKFDEMGVPQSERVGFILNTFYENVRLFKERGFDFWLSFGGVLPAVERIISKQNGESETAFYRRTGYPKYVVDAYSLDSDFATLVFADTYRQAHAQTKPLNTAVWNLNDDGLYINLNEYENRLNGLK